MLSSMLIQIENFLLHYSIFTGLRINYEKLVMVPINTSAKKMKLLDSALGCTMGSMPFTYLGLPVSLKLKLENFVPILKRVEQRLSSCSNMLYYGEKLVLVKSVFANLPIFFMISLCQWIRSTNTLSTVSGENMVWKIETLL